MWLPSKVLNTFSRQTVVLSLLALWMVILAGCAPLAGRPAGAPLCSSNSWPHEQSGLQPDPAIHYERLANGLRYVFMENHEPKNRVGLYLYIQSGSLHETDEQRGLSHFLEHMLFNGTTNFPPGSLVSFFQAMGMSFGEDTNAYTGFDRTVYKIVLPGGEEKHLRDGLLVMSDYARGALLTQSEVERERGVILAEKRTRDSAEYRIYEGSNAFVFAGTTAAERMVIGTEEVLKSASAADLRRYYDTWYRPENMVLVVVGDTDPALARKVVEERLGGLVPAGPAPSCREFGRLAHDDVEYFYMHEPEVGHTDIALDSMWDMQTAPDSLERRRKELTEYVAVGLFNNRLARLVRQREDLFTTASAHSGVFFQRIGYATLNATTDGENWENGLEQLNITLRQALLHGFTPDELERGKKEVSAYLEKKARTAGSRDSNALAGEIIQHLGDKAVMLAPGTEQQLYAPMLAAMTLEEANAAFRGLWSHGNKLVQLTGTADAAGTGSETAENRLRRAFKASEAVTPEHYLANSTLDFPYLPVPEQTGNIVKTEKIDDIDTRRFFFANGLVLNVKKTDFKPNELMAAIHFGNGLLDEPTEGLARLAQEVLNESGLGRFTRDELTEALAGHNVQTDFKVNEESFVLMGAGLSDELETLFQLMYARLHDPAFRPEAYRLVMERFSQEYDKLENSIEGALLLDGEKFLAGNHPRYGMPAREQVKNLTLEQVEQWLGPILVNTPLPEISIVGDVDVEEVKKTALKYFGGARENRGEIKKGEPIGFPAAQTLQKEVATDIDKALVMLAWPTADIWDISRTRRLSILGEVLADRLRLEVREKMGAAYSAVAYNQPSRVDPGRGVLKTRVIVDPQLSDKVAGKLREIVADLVANGPTAEEVQRAVGPVSTSIRDMMRSNFYWLNTVLALSSRHPQQLRWPLSIRQDYAAITAGELAALSREYLDPERAATLILRPAQDTP